MNRYRYRKDKQIKKKYMNRGNIDGQKKIYTNSEKIDREQKNRQIENKYIERKKINRYRKNRWIEEKYIEKRLTDRGIIYRTI